MGHALGAINQDQRSLLVGQVRKLGYWIDRAEDVGRVDDAHELGARRDQLPRGLHVEPPVVGERDMLQRSPGLLLQ